MTRRKFMKCSVQVKRNNDWFECVSFYWQNGEEHKYIFRGVYGEKMEGKFWIWGWDSENVWNSIRKEIFFFWIELRKKMKWFFLEKKNGEKRNDWNLKPCVVDIRAISNVVFFAPLSISSILNGFLFQYGKNSAFPIVKYRGVLEGKKSKCVRQKNVFVCVVLFLALKQRYRLIRVFGNMSVNNG